MAHPNDVDDHTLEGFVYIGALEVKSVKRMHELMDRPGVIAGFEGLHVFMCLACGCLVADQEQHARFNGRAARHG
jgi:hypothetical protein